MRKEVNGKMKRKILLLISLVLLLNGCGNADVNQADEEAKQAETQTQENQKERLTSQVVVIGGNREALEAALAAAENGAESVIVLGYGEADEEELLKEVNANERIVFFPEATAGGLLMDTREPYVR